MIVNRKAFTLFWSVEKGGQYPVREPTAVCIDSGLRRARPTDAGPLSDRIEALFFGIDIENHLITLLQVAVSRAACNS